MNEVLLKNCVQEFKNNNFDSFNEFFLETKKVVFYNIYSIVNSYELSEDLTQETYISFLNKVSELDLTKSVAGYLLTISKNIALNTIKRENKKEDIEDLEIYVSSNDKYKTNEEILLSKIKEIVNEKEFDVFIKHEYGELTFDEIAKLKKIPLATAIFQYNSAIKKLRKGLKEYESD